MTIRPTIWLNDFIVRLNPNPLQPLRKPRITQLTSGNFLVSWADSFNLDDSLAGSDVIAQMFDPPGVPIGGRIRLNTNTSDNESEADIAAMPGGGFTVIWNSLIGGFPFSGIVSVMQIFNALGTATNNIIELNSGARAGFDVGVRPANSTFIFAAADIATAGRLSSISIQAFGSSGTPTTSGNPATITAAQSVEFFDPQIAGLAPTAALPSGGRYVVDWTSDSGTSDGIFFSIFDGTQPIVSQRAVTSDSERANEAALIAVPDGGFFIV